MAIAFDNVTGLDSSGSTGTINHTATGSNLILFCSVFIQNNETISGITCAGSNMTFIDRITNGGDRTELWYIVGISAGSNSVVASFSSTFGWEMRVITYTGAAQSGQPDAHLGQLSGASNPNNFTLTSVADNCWQMMICRCNSSAPTGSVGTNRGAGGAGTGDIFVDTNGVIHPAGSSTISVNQSPAGTAYQVGCTFAPFTGSATVLPFKSLMGVGK